jgi:drug/metabolite transporter (DMT)-like permease
LKFAILIVICSIMLALGQVCWKTALMAHGFTMSVKGLSSLASCWQLWMGFAIIIPATLVWFAILDKAPFSLAYPLMSLSYVFGMIASRVFFNEPITLYRWSGVALICLGVSLIAKK